MFSKILIANRGEVAVRIIRACREMGIQTVAVYSEADKEAFHVSLADESYCIGAPPLSESYLNQNILLTLAKQTGAQAIHPGYGMLSENAEFAKRCGQEGLVFIGPEAKVIRTMGQKDAAREMAKRAGVPVMEGSELLSSVKEAKAAALKCGYPVLLKARAGGGGKGIRLIESEDQLAHGFESVRAEAQKAFGDGELYLEKYLQNVKHIEVQIIADVDGKVIAVGDRDCSVQRKNQKLLEECPAPVLEEKARKKIYRAARKLVQTIGYTTVGTIEFLVTKDGQFYFLEMNTRLQVEHSVTEMTYGIDLVKWQIRTAAGCTLPFGEEDLVPMGHAIECRICAENSDTFRPSCGTVEMLHIPGGPRIRFDTALYQGCEVPPYYDSMLGKLIVCANTREESIRKMKSALSELVIVGVEQNRDFHMRLTDTKDFQDGTYTTACLRGSYDI